MDTSKIIKGVVNSGRYTVTAPIVKEDYGLYLQIEGVELPSTYEVDFSNSEHNGTSVTMIGNSDGVLIPHQFIDTGKDVFAFLYHVGANYGRTVYKFRIPNKVRPDRTDDTPTPEQASVIDQAISALNTAVEQTAQDVIDADASAQSASQSAENAHDSAVDAQNYAETAQTSANNASASASQASASATASAQSASQSAQIKADVEDMVDDAQGYAQASAQSASASANSAIQASLSESEAERAKGNAQTYASQAQTSAQTASSKAQGASTSAQTASTKATESAQSASQALTYKTDAESAKTASQTAQGLAESARDTAVQAKTDAESARDEAQNLVDGISGKVEQIESNTERIESLEDDRYKPYVTDFASGSIASFTDGADDIPLKSLVVDINPVQDLHGYDSPWVGGGGKNLCDASQDNSIAYTSAYAHYSVEDGKVTTNGNVLMGFIVPVKPSTTYTFSLKKATTNSCQLRVRLYSGLPTGWSDAFISQPVNYFVDTSLTSANVTFETTAETTYAVCGMFVTGASLTLSDFQVEVGSTATDWTPYENICPISGWTGCEVNASKKNLFDNTGINNPTTWEDLSRNHYAKALDFIKGGETYIVSGKATQALSSTYMYLQKYVNGHWVSDYNLWQNNVDRMPYTFTADNTQYRIWAFNASTTINIIDWIQIELGSTATSYESYTGRSIPISWADEAGTVYGGKLDVLSGKLTVYPYYASYNGETLTGEWISDRDVYVAGTTPTIGAQVVNIGAEGTEYQLTPHEVNSLLGVNNIWADTGDSAVEYRADTKLYIEKLTQPEEDDMIADSAITSGQFFMIGNSLYRALANIASGATITIGTNAQRVSLADALNLVNA